VPNLEDRGIDVDMGASQRQRDYMS
jgi:hypothetical protein